MCVGPACVTRKQLRVSVLGSAIYHRGLEDGDDEAKRNLQDSNVCLVANIHPALHRDWHRCWRSRRVLLQRIPARNMAARLYEQG